MSYPSNLGYCYSDGKMLYVFPYAGVGERPGGIPIATLIECGAAASAEELCNEIGSVATHAALMLCYAATADALDMPDWSTWEDIDAERIRHTTGGEG